MNLLEANALFWMFAAYGWRYEALRNAEPYGSVWYWRYHDRSLTCYGLAEAYLPESCRLIRGNYE